MNVECRWNVLAAGLLVAGLAGCAVAKITRLQQREGYAYLRS